MIRSTPLESLAAAIAHAVYEGLPVLDYEDIDSRALYSLSAQEREALRERENRGEKAMPRRRVRRRPAADECVVRAMFPQTWSSTALGFGGIGGAAMTTAYTCIIEGPAGDVAVYWAGRFAYLVSVRNGEQTPEQAKAFADDLTASHTVRRSEAGERYGATVGTAPSVDHPEQNAVLAILDDIEALKREVDGGWSEAARDTLRHVEPLVRMLLGAKP